MLIFGWSCPQWAHARQRHKLHGNADPGANINGLICVQQWWRRHMWPEPLSVQLEGVVPQVDNEWAANAICAALCVLPSAAAVEK